MAATNRLRTEGTANLLAAARQLGARRFITQSMVFGYGFGEWACRVPTEAGPFAPPGNGRFEAHLAALRANEEQVLGAKGVDGIALGYSQANFMTTTEPKGAVAKLPDRPEEPQHVEAAIGGGPACGGSGCRQTHFATCPESRPQSP